MKRFLKILACVILTVLAFFVFFDLRVSAVAEPKMYNDAETIPYKRVALVLGTSPKRPGGRDNMYFVYRIEAAARLYEAGKADFFVVSGDNRTVQYNEPVAMKKALVAAGIPESVIYLDYAGFRTLDSVIRMNTIFSQTEFTIVSQRFHNERALFLARSRGLDAIGFNARDVSIAGGFKTRLRERLARVRLLFDLVTGKEPHFGGEKIEIGPRDGTILT